MKQICNNKKCKCVAHQDVEHFSTVSYRVHPIEAEARAEHERVTSEARANCHAIYDETYKEAARQRQVAIANKDAILAAADAKLAEARRQVQELDTLTETE